MFLFKPKYLDDNLTEFERLCYVRKVKSTKHKRQIIKDKSIPYFLRKDLLQWEKDKDFCETIVRDLDEDERLRCLAFERIGNSGKASQLCEWILNNVRFDPFILHSFALGFREARTGSGSSKLYFFAAEILCINKRQDILEKVYNSTPHKNLKIIMLLYITNQSFLFDVAKNTKDNIIFEAATKNIHDVTMLKELNIEK